MHSDIASFATLGVALLIIMFHPPVVVVSSLEVYSLLFCLLLHPFSLAIFFFPSFFGIRCAFGLTPWSSLTAPILFCIRLNPNHVFVLCLQVFSRKQVFISV